MQNLTKPRKPFDKTCECCGATFSRQEGEILSTYKHRRYCTLPCKEILHKERMDKNAKKKYGENCLEDRPCENCKEPIKYADFDTPGDFMARKACSNECASALRVRTKQSKKPKKPKMPKIKSVSDWLGRMKRSDRLEQMAVIRGLIQ